MPGPGDRGLATKCVHGGRGHRRDAGLAPPIFPASVYSFASLADSIDTFEGRRIAPLYARYGHPTGEEVEERVAALEGAEASVLVASGMAAVSMVLAAFCRSGDHVLASREQYGGTTELLRRAGPAQGLEVEFVRLEDLGSLGSRVRPRTRLVFLESPTNPLLRIVDFAALRVGLGTPRPLLALDGTLATPLGQDALGLGVDLVFHSATKYLGGHDDLTAGVVSGRRDLVEPVRQARRILGAMCDPMTAWLLGRGLKTLAVRWDRQCASAAQLASRLQQHPGVIRVAYPGLPTHPHHELARTQMRSFGALLAFEVHGGMESSRRVYDRLELIARAPSLGGVDSMMLHPATASHRTLSPEERQDIGIGDGLLRLSVGLEDPEDLWADLAHALGE